MLKEIIIKKKINKMYKPSNHCYYDTNSGTFKDYPSHKHTNWTTKLNLSRDNINKVTIKRICNAIKSKSKGPRTPKNVKKAILLVSNAID